MGKTVSLTAEDSHSVQAYIAEPTDTPRFGLVVIQEIFGVNAHIRSICDGFAADGILAVAPALFDRVAPGTELGYGDDDVTEGRALRGKLGWDAPLLDVAEAARIASIGSKVGTVGYCWGGSLSWLAACRLGSLVDASVTYYGGQIHEFRDATPAVPVMMHFGAHDPLIPPDHVDAIRAAHQGVPVFDYPAGHGFNCDQRADYDPDSSGTARARTLAFLAEHLAG